MLRLPHLIFLLFNPAKICISDTSTSCWQVKRALPRKQDGMLPQQHQCQPHLHRMGLRSRTKDHRLLLLQGLSRSSIKIFRVRDGCSSTVCPLFKVLTPVSSNDHFSGSLQPPCPLQPFSSVCPTDFSNQIGKLSGQNNNKSECEERKRLK